MIYILHGWILEILMSERSQVQKIARTILQSSKTSNSTVLFRDTNMWLKFFLSKGMINKIQNSDYHFQVCEEKGIPRVMPQNR